MITASNILFGAGIASALCAVTSAMMIVGALEKRGVRIEWVWLRLRILKYLGQYREITRQESGHTGPLFYGYVIGMIVALAAAIAGLVLRIG